ncbi:hypothetical protein V7S43_009170 [Phytophthora oleae]|uniref:Enoyl reductase (ER) domain-containing protein n=1 Tax=Phytophthora oleae TaxID=2107226 RepID=A0ABD3FIK9_9STRA
MKVIFQFSNCLQHHQVMSTGPRTVHAYACFGKNGSVQPWEYQSRPLGAEDVEIKISHCGICGSDLHMMDCGWKSTRYPCVVGHEIVGEVTLAGSDVKGWRSVTASERKVGTYNGTYKNDGATSYGGYADYIRVTHEYAFKIPDNIPSDVAAPLLCAGTTVFTPFKEFAKAMGAAAVVAFSRSANKEQEIRRLGADEFVVYTDEKQAADAANSVDILLITADANDMPYMLFLSFLAVRGTCIMVGLPNDDVKFNAFGVVGKGASFKGSMIGSIQDIKDMLEVASKKNVRPVIQKLPMSKVNEGIQMVRDGTARYRVVLEN